MDPNKSFFSQDTSVHHSITGLAIPNQDVPIPTPDLRVAVIASSRVSNLVRSLVPRLRLRIQSRLMQKPMIQPLKNVFQI